ncbi:MAG: radical SAM family heme chaperone HemW [Clostridia bacterium]|nr:radical SAM family heme chaperone HemW [Clostridia bacterium]
MKKNNKKKKNPSANSSKENLTLQQKGETTQEMDALLQAASIEADPAESNLLLSETENDNDPSVFSKQDTAQDAANETKTAPDDAYSAVSRETIFDMSAENAPDSAMAAPTAADTASPQIEETPHVKEESCETAAPPSNNGEPTILEDRLSTQLSADAPEAEPEDTTERNAVSGNAETDILPDSATADVTLDETQDTDTSAALFTDEKSADDASSTVFSEMNMDDAQNEHAEPIEEEADITEDNDRDEEQSQNSDIDSLIEEPYKPLGLYIHIPFCKSKCAYCDFYSTDKIQCSGHKTPEEMKLYVNALKNQMRIFSERTTQYNVDTIFIGGGTPTALPEKLLLQIVKEVDRCFYLEDGYEFTVEMNPATANLHMLKKLHHAGVNRLSIGLQSAHNHELAALSRIHTTGDFTECFQMAREAGFDNINIDVMYGIPEQTKASFMDTLAFVASMKPEHISMYNLRIEDGTPFGERKHMLPLPDEDTECDMYFDGIAYLASEGYKQYEISNFAKEGRECRHNLKYWHGEEYLGCGPAAHSYFGHNRFSLRRSLAQYCKALEVKGKSIPSSLLEENYSIDKKEEIAEYLMLRLRLNEGISSEDFAERFGGSFDTVFGKKLQVYVDRGFMTHENGRWAFTPQGMFVSNYILSRIIPFSPKYSPIS